MVRSFLQKIIGHTDSFGIEIIKTVYSYKKDIIDIEIMNNFKVLLKRMKDYLASKENMKSKKYDKILY